MANPPPESGLEVAIIQASDQQEETGGFQLRDLNFNQRIIAAREQFIQAAQAINASSQPATATSFHKHRNSSGQPSQQQGEPERVVPDDSRRRQANNRWYRRSWSRHTRSPSGESSCVLWGGIVMRTTWNDDDRTMVNSDSELETIDIPRPSRWREPLTCKCRWLEKEGIKEGIFVDSRWFLY